MPSSSAAADQRPAAAEAGADAVPASLRTWFRVAGLADVASAIPLLFAPVRTLGLLGWTSIDSVTTRLCGAALLGLGVAALRVNQYGLTGYRALLGIQVVWSLAAVFAMVAGIGDGAPEAAWAFLSIFIGFAGVWTSYAIRLRQMARAGLLDPQGTDEDNAAASDDAEDGGPDDPSDPDDPRGTVR